LRFSISCPHQSVISTPYFDTYCDCSWALCVRRAQTIGTKTALCCRRCVAVRTGEERMASTRDPCMRRDCSNPCIGRFLKRGRRGGDWRLRGNPASGWPRRRARGRDGAHGRANMLLNVITSAYSLRTFVGPISHQPAQLCTTFARNLHPDSHTTIYFHSAFPTALRIRFE